MPLKDTEYPAIAIGSVTGEYEFDPDAPEGMRHIRHVNWIKPNVPKDVLDSDLRASIGSLVTICRIERNNATERVQALVNGDEYSGNPDDSSKIRSFAELSEKVPTQITARDLLALGGMQRRSAGNLLRIYDELESYRLKTGTDISDLESIDSPVTVTSMISAPGTHGANNRERFALNIGRLASFRDICPEVVDVSPEDEIGIAATAMIHNNYSQLAVTDNGALLGAITWDSIAHAYLFGKPQKVKDALVPTPPLVFFDTSIEEALDTVQKHGYALVQPNQAEDTAPIHIVTVQDFVEAFGEARLPLSLIEEIELHLRRLAKSRLSDDDIRDSAARCNKFSEMTLGAYPYLFSNGTEKSAAWNKLGMTNVDHAAFVANLREVANIRNKLMHFSGDPISPEQLKLLKGVLSLMRAMSQTTNDWN